MNLYARLCLLLLRITQHHQQFSPFSPIKLKFRVWPQDIDVNFHLTAARYFSFGDLGRIAWLAHNKLLWRFLRQGYQGVLNAQEITYIREFKPFSRIDLEIELKCWDEKYGYFEQRFYSQGQLFAVSHARLALLHKKKVTSFALVFKQLGFVINNQPETEAIADWKATLQAKRDHFS